MNFNNKNILITGGTGSFGQKCVETLLRDYKPKRLIIFSRDELKQYEMSQVYSEAKYPCLRYFIGDVRDVERIKRASVEVDIIIHAAAMKHVSASEYNPTECIETNINGAKNVIDAAITNNIKKVIALSTDKAASPINLYGATKLCSDKLFIAANNLSGKHKTRFSVVRYGNVIASRGSFIPLWTDLVNNNQVLKITSTEMTRFLFTLEDAVDAVLGTLNNALGGEVFVPQINSYTLPTCVKALETILGKKAKTKVIGLRPGEKLHEDMLAKTELDFTYEVPGINLLQIRPQYTNKTHQNWEKYDGPEFNSALWVKEDINEVVELIQEGIKQ